MLQTVGDIGKNRSDSVASRPQAAHNGYMTNTAPSTPDLGSFDFDGVPLKITGYVVFTPSGDPLEFTNKIIADAMATTFRTLAMPIVDCKALIAIDEALLEMDVTA